MNQARKYLPQISPLAFAVATVLATPATTAPVLAQAGVLEEVIVTARKREESLQETPVAVTAFSGTKLEEAGLDDLTDLDRIAPNLIANSGAGGGSTQLYVRGVGARNSGANFDGGVSIYQDGVYLSRSDGTILESVDVQSVQVLRGPQGTLFGKNSTGGAILYNTNKPSDVLEGHAEVNVGNYDQLNTQLTVNLPLLDDALLSRLSLYSTERDGLVEDQFGREFNDIDRWGGQLQLRAFAGENDEVVVDLNAQYNKIDQSSRGQRCRAGLGVPGTGWQSVAQDQFIIVPSTGLTILENCQRTDALDDDKFLSALTGSLPPIYQSESISVAATVDWELSDTHSVKSITSWRNVEAGQMDDVYYAGIPLVLRMNYGFDIAEPRNTDWFSQELQLTGATDDGDITYVLGVFASNEETDAGTGVGQQGPFFGALGNPNLAFYTAEATELLTDNTAYAAFSQVEWSFAQNWNLTLGLRYTWEERKLERNTYKADPATLSLSGMLPTDALGDGRFWSFADGPGDFNARHGHLPATSLQEDVTNDDWNPMASIQYLFEGAGPIESGSVYFTIATGFLSGGLSESLALDGSIPEYDAEQVVNYELGSKLDLLENTLRVNTAVFYTEYDDRQLTSIGVNPETGSIASKTVNAEESTIMGFELETTWLATEHLEFTFNFAINEGEIKEFNDTAIFTANATTLQDCEEDIDIGGGAFVDVCNVDRSDEDLPNLPKQVYYLAGQYTFDTGVGPIVARIDASYLEDLNTCFDYASCLWRNGKGLEVDVLAVGARLTWMSNDGDWRVTAWGNNLTDYDYKAGGNPLIGTTQTLSSEENEPLTYGVEVAYSW